MLNGLNDASQRVGLRMNLDKTKIMSNSRVNPASVTVEHALIETVKEYIYLGQKIQLGRSNFDKEADRRIQLGWAAFGKLRYIFTSDIPQASKTKVFDQCVLPTMTYVDVDSNDRTDTQIQGRSASYGKGHARSLFA